MGMSALLARLATTRCHVLVVEVPGAASVRMEVQRQLRRLEWVEADSPADADVLCVCGAPSGELREAVERVWDQLPGPRVRTTILTAGQVPCELSGCADRLREATAQAADGAGRAREPEEPDGQMDDGEMDHGNMDHEGMDHGGMDHGGMDMPMPGGIGLAGQEEDRDGLDLDVLHLSLGPVLALWPAGLVLRCTMQGDVIFSAKAELLEGTPVPDPLPAGARAVLVHRADLAGRMLRLAGSEAAAERIYRIRDAALEGRPLSACRGPLAAELAALKRSVLLRRSLSGVGVIPADSFHAHAGTDAWARLVGWVEGALPALARPGVPRRRPAHPRSRGLPASTLAGRYRRRLGVPGPDLRSSSRPGLGRHRRAPARLGQPLNNQLRRIPPGVLRISLKLRQEAVSG